MQSFEYIHKPTKGQLRGETEEQHRARVAREDDLGYRRGGPKTKEWKRLRDKFLREQKLDVPGDWWRCETKNGHGCGRLTSSPTVDHIIKRSVRPDLVTVTSNFQILCNEAPYFCHMRKDNGFQYKEKPPTKG